MSSQSEDAGVARDAKFMINPYVRVIQCGNNEVLVKHGSRSRFSELIRDDAKSGLLARILRALSKPVSFGCGSFSSAVQRGPEGAASGMARAT